MAINKSLSPIKTKPTGGGFWRERPASYPLDDGAKAKIYQVTLNNTRRFRFCDSQFLFDNGGKTRVRTGLEILEGHSARFGPFFVCVK